VAGAAFAANAEVNRALVPSCARKAAQAALGGPEESRKRT
jgi:hypothetical protein